ncbi:MAG: SIS domain-containing protein [Desulfamplus sp.]|nr:SIS domain-containing protein [Desulfamplus sp.]
MHNPLQPESWLEELQMVLSRVECRVGNQSVHKEQGFLALEQRLLEVRASDCTVWWVGNGGSAAICSHLSQDMLNKLKLRSMSLNDSSLMTCMSNDFGYANVFKRPLEILANKGDLLIAISSSGNSENIAVCAELARKKGMHLVTLSGFHQNNLLWTGKNDIAFYLPASLYGIVEVGHEALLHAVIETLFLKEQGIHSVKQEKQDS